MIDPHGIASVFQFEMRRARTIPRMAWWVALAGFPIVLSILVSRITKDQIAPNPEVEVARVEVKAIDESGVPTVEIDGEDVTGPAAIRHVQNLGMTPAKRAIQEKLREFGFAGQQGPGPQQFTPDPVLIVKHPDSYDADGESARLFRFTVQRGFSQVVFHAASDAEPNVQPPSTALQLWATGLFILVPTVVSMLGVFLWATPSVSAELERRSWAYLATRPNVAVSVILGKYLVGVTWGTSAALVGAAVSVVIADVPEGFMALFGPMATLVLLGCPAYGAVYTLIGVIMPRRAMVIAVVYSLVFEGVISTVPALINKITVQFRLRCMIVRWLGLDRSPNASAIFSRLGLNETSTFGDVSGLILLTVGALAASVFVLRWKELSQADESDS